VYRGFAVQLPWLAVMTQGLCRRCPGQSRRDAPGHTVAPPRLHRECTVANRSITGTDLDHVLPQNGSNSSHCRGCINALEFLHDLSRCALVRYKMPGRTREQCEWSLFACLVLLYNCVRAHTMKNPMLEWNVIWYSYFFNNDKASCFLFCLDRQQEGPISIISFVDQEQLF